jgi:hypothetical protein
MALSFFYNSSRLGVGIEPGNRRVARPNCYSKVHRRNSQCPLLASPCWPYPHWAPLRCGPSRHLAGVSPHPPQFNFAFPLLPKCKRGLSLHPLPLRMHVRPHNANSMSRPPCSGDRVCHATRSPYERQLEDAWRRWLPGKPTAFLSRTTARPRQAASGYERAGSGHKSTVIVTPDPPSPPREIMRPPGYPVDKAHA